MNLEGGEDREEFQRHVVGAGGEGGLGHHIAVVQGAGAHVVGLAPGDGHGEIADGTAGGTGRIDTVESDVSGLVPAKALGLAEVGEGGVAGADAEGIGGAGVAVFGGGYGGVAAVDVYKVTGGPGDGLMVTACRQASVGGLGVRGLFRCGGEFDELSAGGEFLAGFNGGQARKENGEYNSCFLHG